jgi:hypothetical protein
MNEGMNGFGWDDVVDMMMILLTSSSTSPPNPSGFSKRILCKIELSLQSRAPFADLIFQKRAETLMF